MSESKATTRISAPSSARTLVVTRSAIDVERVGIVESRRRRAAARLRRIVRRVGEVGRLDVGDEAGLEALAQAVLERVHVARQAVGGEHELAAGLVAAR